jgi:hypothetical protein
MFARINAATGKLEFVIWFGLMGEQNVIAAQQDGIDPGTAAVNLPREYRLAVASDHDAPLVRRLP